MGTRGRAAGDPGAPAGPGAGVPDPGRSAGSAAPARAAGCTRPRRRPIRRGMAEERGRARGVAAAGAAEALRPARVQRPEPRPALGLEELLDLLVRQGELAEGTRPDVLGRATTLRSRVLK